MKLTKGFKELVAEAQNEVSSLSPAEVSDRLQRPGFLLVDLRDIRELKREGKIAGSFHVPRGMLEFWIDPDSPYYQPRFDEVSELVLYCNKGWRSALAAKTLQEMGIDKVSHLLGGMEQWLIDIGSVENKL
jgi:rhodanese-related sulfurtransferase